MYNNILEGVPTTINIKLVDSYNKLMGTFPKQGNRKELLQGAKQAKKDNNKVL
jgi:hypothetical protein